MRLCIAMVICSPTCLRISAGSESISGALLFLSMLMAFCTSCGMIGGSEKVSPGVAPAIFDWTVGCSSELSNSLK